MSCRITKAIILFEACFEVYSSLCGLRGKFIKIWLKYEKEQDGNESANDKIEMNNQ